MVKEKKRETLFFSLITTFFMCFVIHGYRFGNTMFSHDSLVVLVQSDAAWEIALGRYFEPVLVFLRGNLCSPWLLCMLQSTWLALSVWLLVDILQIQHKSAIVAIAGLVVSSESFIIVNASFLAWSDLYAFSLFSAVLGVWYIEKKKISCALLGILFMAASLATYQAYISVSIALMLLLGILHLCRFEEDLGKIIKRFVYYAVTLLLTAGIYYAVWQIIRNGLEIWAADTYNGMASLGQYGSGELLKSIFGAYENMFVYFAEPVVMSNMVFRNLKLADIWKYALILINVIVVLITISGVVVICRRQRIRQKPSAGSLTIRYVLLILCILLFPLACNFVCVFSKGMEHPLMLLGVVMVYIFAVIVAEKIGYGMETGPARKDRPYFVQKITAIHLLIFLLGINIWVHFLYANQIYLKKSLQEKAAYSLLTRIVTDIEEIPGYVPGVTPVSITGNFEDSPYLTELPGFENVKPYFMGKTALTYQGVDYAMINYYLGVNLNLTRVDASTGEISQMPLYPAAGSISEVDGVIVVKISP